MLRKPTEPFTIHFFQCLGRAKNIDRFLQHSGYELHFFLNFMLFIATNIYKSYHIWLWQPPFLTGLYKIYLEDLCCVIPPPLQMKYWGGGYHRNFCEIFHLEHEISPPLHTFRQSPRIFHWLVLTCLNHKPCQLEIGGHYLHESLSTLWEIQVFGFQGSMVAMLKHAETKQGWCRCGSHSGIGSVGERWAYLGHWYLTVRGQRWNSWICQRMSKTGYCKSICQGCFQFHWLRTKVRGSKTIRYHQVSSGPLMHLVM